MRGSGATARSRSSTCTSGEGRGDRPCLTGPRKGSESQSMSQKIAALAARVNEKATTDAARWAYEGSVPFVDLGSASLGGEVPHVHRFRLGNGLKVLVLVDRSAPVMSYFTWFRVGSRHEKP